MISNKSEPEINNIIRLRKFPLTVILLINNKKIVLE